ncbi:hypothetical protein INT45_003386 [Circinella minor]|uniref:Uncharacterized protein n=1 Tax=Circinella minor TaxID=1195481 RepID=A0A8H7SBR7_9FUNG|nr:hypothetical protein INT45_003386 [Circinella minor]
MRFSFSLIALVLISTTGVLGLEGKSDSSSLSLGNNAVEESDATSITTKQKRNKDAHDEPDEEEPDEEEPDEEEPDEEEPDEDEPGEHGGAKKISTKGIKKEV